MRCSDVSVRPYRCALLASGRIKHMLQSPPYAALRSDPSLKDFFISPKALLWYLLLAYACVCLTLDAMCKMHWAPCRWDLSGRAFSPERSPRKEAQDVMSSKLIQSSMVLPVILVLAIAICSCATTQRKPQRAVPGAPYEFEKEGKIPPLNESDIRREADYEELSVQEEEVVEEEVLEEDVMPSPDTTRIAMPSEPAVEKQPGFRVQVLAAGSETSAEALKLELQKKIGAPVYVELIEGLYKVRVGDCTDRSEAEALLRRCREAGYRDAWIVPALVTISPKEK